MSEQSRVRRRTPSRRWGRVVAAASVLAVPVLSAAFGLALDDYDQPPIAYSTTRPADPIARLQERIDRGEVKLAYDPERGYLPGVMRALEIPVSSQSLVFSKTSFQRDKISPRTPRALYFNDHTYLGWVQGGPVLEISSTDPQLGGVFYILDQEQTAKPKFVRQTHECLSCHSSTLTANVPGHIVRSVFADATGQPNLSAGTFITTDESPMNERWGGWYVTGTHGEVRHMGNLLVHSARQAESPDLDRGANVTDLSKLIDTAPYLSRHSDLVALMVLQHQSRLHNLITKAGYETKLALHYEEALGKALGKPENDHLDSTLSRIRSVGEPLVRGLLFSKEAPLSGPVKGTTVFAAEFARKGPWDSRKRSLREFDLKQRLFRYPCSFLIHSEAFQGLPAPAKEYVYRRFHEILGGKDQTPEFQHLSAADRTAILEILTDTEPGFAAWRKAHAE